VVVVVFVVVVWCGGVVGGLRSAAHFADVLGERVRIREQGRHRASVVEVLAVDDAGVTVQPDGGEQRLVPFDEIIRCKLVVEDPFAAAAQRMGGACAGKSSKQSRCSSVRRGSRARTC
jgi:hypothetical protein